MSEPSSPTETSATPPPAETPVAPVVSNPSASNEAVAAANGNAIAPVVSDLPAPVIPPKKAAPPAPPAGTSSGGSGRSGGGGPLGRFLGGGGESGDGKKDDGEGGKMGFMDHLMELRNRLWVSALILAISIVLAAIFYEQIFEFIRLPLDKVNIEYRSDDAAYREVLKKLRLSYGADIVQLSSLDPLDTMMMLMWLALGTGLLCSSPIILYEGWAFVAPGLRDREKNAIRPVLTAGIGFFMIGASIAYFILFPVTMSFLVWLNVRLGVQPLWSVEKYSSLLLTMMGLCGLVCESPLVVAVLAKLGLVKASHLTRFWRPIVLGAFVAGSVLSPGTDVMSMLLFTALLLSVYIVSILFAWAFYRDKK